jgi:DNA-binding response OmpR family regulator
MPRDIERGLEAGFFRYLTKPIKVSEFMDHWRAGKPAVPGHADGARGKDGCGLAGAGFIS